MTKAVGIIATGTANLASMCAAFQRLGEIPILIEDAAAMNRVERLVLPGVGSFGSGMQRIDALGIREELVAWLSDGKPFLAVCLGLQLLCRESEESPGVAGLGIVDTTVSRFRNAPLVPQLGWNKVVPHKDDPLILTGHAYYANSYRLTETPPDWLAAHSEHGEPFVAAMSRGSALACQFHPELSGAWGQALLERWLGSSSLTTGDAGC